MKNMLMFYTVYKPTKVYWVEKQKLFDWIFFKGHWEKFGVCV